MGVKPNKRFLIVDDYKHYQLGDGEHILKSVWVLDYEWFYTVDKEINEWLTEYKCVMPGMIIKFPDEQTMTMFLLRWSS